MRRASALSQIICAANHSLAGPLVGNGTANHAAIAVPFLFVPVRVIPT